MTSRAYEQHRERTGQVQRAKSQAGRELGELRQPEDIERRKACRLSLRLFCESYHRETFCLPWSDDHLRVLARAQQCILEGGQFALAMPRASGKTAIIIAATEWALLYGHRRFVVPIGASEMAAVELLKLIKGDLETPDTVLSRDFPEVCQPIEALEGIANRCAGQTYKGERTHITWTDRALVLPSIAGSAASGSVLRVAGITGRLRGMVARLPDGRKVRPDIVLIDDPQTDESARSPSMCAQRERILAGAVLGMAGPGKSIAALAAVTVIQRGDVADNLVSRDLHPEWSGERTKLAYSFPTAVKLWEQYGEMRAEGLRTARNIAAATEFYRANREAMDAGAEVAWPARFKPDELSAVQHVMNLRLQDEAAFMAEYQNSPLSMDQGTDQDVALLGPDQIMRRLSGCPEGVVPNEATRITGFIDVQQRLLYWMVCAWRDDFTGWVIAYGSFPGQDRDRFLYADAARTLAHAFPESGLESQLAQGLRQLSDDLCGREWLREDGAPMRLERLMVDANWTAQTETVYVACRRSAHSQQMIASHGAFFGLSARPIMELPKKPGDRGGYGWRMPADSATRVVRFDAGLWKSFVHARLSTAPGDVGSLTLFGRAPARHRMLAEHLTSETRERLEGNGRVLDVWELMKHRDNHLLDCLVGCAVGASIGGTALPGMEPARQPRARRKLRLSDLQGRRVG